MKPREEPPMIHSDRPGGLIITGRKEPCTISVGV